MLGNRLKKLRTERLLTLTKLAQEVGKSQSTLSRYENNQIDKVDLELIEKIAQALNSSAAYLLGMTDDRYYRTDVKTSQYYNQNGLMNILVTDDQMEPDLPEGACVQIRELAEDEELSVGSYYYIQFNQKKVFRMVVESEEDGAHFLPMDLSEQRIAYDKDYVKIIGKAVSMKVFFEDF